MAIRPAVAELIHTFKLFRPSAEIPHVLGVSLFNEGLQPYGADAAAQASMKSAVAKLGVRAMGYPVADGERRLWSVLVRLKDEKCPMSLLSQQLQSAVQQLLEHIGQQEAWTVGYLVRGIGSMRQPQFTVGRCEFQPWAPPSGMFPQVRSSMVSGQLEARTTVNAADREHAAAIALGYVEESLCLLRYGSIIMGAMAIGNPVVGMTPSQNFGMAAVMSTCFSVNSPLEAGHSYSSGNCDVNYDIVNGVPGWQELESVLNVERHKRNDVQIRIVAGLSWIGEANLSRSPAVRLVSIVTGLESLLLLPHEAKGKKRKLCARVAAFPKLKDMSGHVEEAEVGEVYEGRCDCVHGGQLDISPGLDRSAIASFSQSVVGVYEQMADHGLTSLKFIIDKVCPQSLRMGEDA